MTEIVRMEGIDRRFGETIALQGASFSASAGAVNALLGENGAGKTTLMRILSGLVRAEAGRISIGGRETRIDSPRTAISAGIAMVHQHFMLVPDFTGLENIAMAHGWEAARKAQSMELLDQYRVDLSRPAGGLSMGERQRVEIVRALSTDCSILILDEPTAVLSPLEIDELFAVLRKLVDSRRTVVFISHKLQEVKKLCDTVTVLRRGRTVLTGVATDFSEADLAATMVGETIIPAVRRRPVGFGKAMLELRGVRAPGFGPIDLAVHAGEIVGVAGVDGNGQQSLLQSAGGLLGVPGTYVGGEPCSSAHEALRSGLRIIPSDRQREGLVQGLSALGNLMLANEEIYAYRPLPGLQIIRKKRAEGRAAATLARFAVSSELHTPASDLSGGNQQKLLLARVFSARPRVLVAMNPTWGLDVRATAFVQAQIVEAAESGTAVLLISSDLDEVQTLSDAVVVLYRGRLSGRLAPDSPGIARRMMGLKA